MNTDKTAAEMVYILRNFATDGTFNRSSGEASAALDAWRKRRAVDCLPQLHFGRGSTEQTHTERSTHTEPRGFYTVSL